MKLKPEHKQIIDDLKAGNRRFLSGTSMQSPETSLQKLKLAAERGQSPKAIILCCSDARAPCEIIFDQGLGDLFVIRVAGNVVAPSLVGSVEFAAATFGTSLVLVMGHTDCGAVRATMKHIEYPDTIASENIHDIVSRIRPHIFAISKLGDMSQEDKMRLAVEANVMASVDMLSHSSRLIETKMQKGEIQIIGSVLDLATGQVTFLEG
jgi:carbonic anhydrase